MASGDIKLGLTGSEITLPSYGRQLTISDIELKKVQTMASGKEVEDIIGYKKEFAIAYEVLEGSDLEAVLALYDLHADLNLIITNRAGSEITYANVILEPIPQIRELCHASLWLWANPVLKLRTRECIV